MRHSSIEETSITVYGPADGRKDGAAKRFRIHRTCGQGRLTVSYEAASESDGLTGTLKEYAPCYDISLERDPSGTLSASREFESAYLKFINGRDRFLQNHQALQQIREKNGGRASGFILPFDIYMGHPPCDVSGDGTVYLWFSGSAGMETYKEAVDQIGKSGMQTSRDLAVILQTIRSLTAGVMALHHVGLVCTGGGINPDTVMLRKRAGELSPEDAVLTDTDLIVSIFDDEKRDFYLPEWPEFAAPEIEAEGTGRKNDVFAIGAMLFYGITGSCYQYADYSRLHQMLAESEMIASAETACPGISDAVVGILQMCLCSRIARCQSCEPLSEALDQALLRLFQNR